MPGFGHAYLFGACACLVSLLLALGPPLLGARRRDGSD